MELKRFDSCTSNRCEHAMMDIDSERRATKSHMSVFSSSSCFAMPSGIWHRCCYLYCVTADRARCVIAVVEPVRWDQPNRLVE
jgi:hypothetical protein